MADSEIAIRPLGLMGTGTEDGQANGVAAPSLDDPALYFNREISWLEFNRRVLEEAQDPQVPLLERLKFLAIFASNLDEFFMVRVGGCSKRCRPASSVAPAPTGCRRASSSNASASCSGKWWTRRIDAWRRTCFRPWNRKASPFAARRTYHRPNTSISMRCFGARFSPY